MANRIENELLKVEGVCQEIQNYLDANPINQSKDRYGPPNRFNEKKCVSKKEDQAKAYMDLAAKLPKLLNELNELRNKVIGTEEKIKIRGDQDIPDFMKTDEEEEQNSSFQTKTNPQSIESIIDKSLGDNGEDDSDEDEDDDW